ncbi:MAG: hypothetical protein ACK4VN_15700 [Bacteroidales bacterium]
MWNNPLKYTDPDGEIVFTILAAIFAPPLLPLAIAADMGGLMNMALNSSSIDNGWKALGYYGIGAAAGAIGAGVGMGVSAALAGGSFWAGVAGTSLHVTTGFAAGFVSGAAGGFSGGFVSGFGIAAMNRENNLADMFFSGLDYGWKGAIVGGIAGGIYGGIDAVSHDRNFWTGAEKQHGYVRINPDGSSSFADLNDVRTKQTRDGLRTNIENNKGVSIDDNGRITIRHSRSINRITSMESSINHPIDNVIIGRRGLSFTPWIDRPDHVLLHGYRYHSNPITSIRHLFYFRLR